MVSKNPLRNFNLATPPPPPPPAPNLPPAPTFKGLFITYSFPIIIILIILIVESAYFFSICWNLSSNWVAHESQLSIIVSRYSDQFTPTEVNSSQYNIHTSEMAEKASHIASTNGYQLLISCGIVIITLVLSFINSLTRSSQKYLGAHPTRILDKQEHWLSSGTNISTSISGAVSAGIAIVGAISLLSPGVVGGFVIAGLEILLLCVIFGIMIQMVGSGIVVETGQNNIVKIDLKSGAIWEGLIAMQFLMLVIGIILIILEVISF